VLLLEMNLRYPSLARVLGFRPPVCFGDQLEFHRTHPMQPWVVVENLSPHLHVAAVSPDTQARALVDGPAVAIAIEQLRAADYHYIVLDCPPVLGSADLNLLTEHVDGVLFSMWLRRSRLRQLRRAMDQIGREKVIGSVLVGGP
jgi:Mrp family chromosome partitioning ATPase